MKPWPEGYARRVLPTVDSTLNEAARCAPAAQSPLWILALEQTHARARRGRSWTAPTGNFAATLLLQPNGTASEAALRSFVMSLALLRSFEVVAGDNAGLTLKWPNDVLLNGGKVAGILLESVGQGQGVAHLAIGVGVNLLAAPKPSEVEPRAVRPVSLAEETGVRVAPEAFLEVLAAEYAELEHHYMTYGFDPIRAAWIARAARLGEVITARTGQTETTGTFDDVDAAGNLILNTARGRVLVASGDVFFDGG